MAMIGALKLKISAERNLFRSSKCTNQSPRGSKFCFQLARMLDKAASINANYLQNENKIYLFLSLLTQLHVLTC